MGVFVDWAVGIVSPYRDTEILERCRARRGKGVRESAVGVQRADGGFQCGDDVAGTTHLHAGTGHIGFSPSSRVSRPARDVAGQWHGLPGRLVAVEATEVGRNPGGATDFGPEVETRQPGQR